MRLIDANEAIKNIVAERDKIPYELVSEKPFKHGNSMRGGIRKALRCIEQSPTVDAIPVVRCKYCIRRYDTDECPMCYLSEGKYYEYTNENGFCDRGERKEGAE